MVTRRTATNLVRAAQEAGVTDPHVLEAIRTVPREAFAPPEYVTSANLDEPLPIPHDQVTTQPSLCARMLAALHLTRDSHVLEIGTGLGYQTALLAFLARSVVSVERRPELAALARRNLNRQHVEHVVVLVGDGTDGAPDHAPYDAVVVAAAFPEVPPPLIDQLRPGGWLVQPIGSGSAERVTSFERTTDRLESRAVVCGARFVRLYGHYGFRAG